uniref:Nuclear pore protein n=1 Tax=Rhizochromulina marina TaxID=1034831 RepID=A0A7S2SNK3_9STRA|mmetsp:Transcript_33144/g.95995  ORF Transcript_33144/g.95995 Transcript_33144/m.95995 type:complete len:582 (+) Transcript_33144:39-1784(+)
MAGTGGQGVLDRLKELRNKAERDVVDIDRPDGIRPLRYSLEELLPKYRVSTRPAAASAEASRLLAQYGFDVEGLSTFAPTQLSTDYKVVADGLATTDVEGFLRHHHDVVVSNAVEEAKQAVEARLLEQQRDQEYEQWQRERQDILSSLGVLHMNEQVRALNTPRKTDGDLMDMSALPSAPRSIIHEQRVLLDGPSDGISPGEAGALVVAHSEPSLPSSAAASDMSPTMREYASVVRRMNQHSFGHEAPSTMARGFGASGQGGGGGDGGAFYPATRFLEIASALVPDRHHADYAVVAAYQKCWALVRGMIGEMPELEPSHHRVVLRSGFLEPLKQGSAKAAWQTAIAARRFLEFQNWTEYMAEQVALLRQQHGHGAGAAPPSADALVEDIRWVSELQGLSSPPHTWPVLYYCMRCGAVRKARDVAEEAVRRGGGEVPREVVNALNALVDLQSATTVENGDELAGAQVTAWEKCRKDVGRCADMARDVEPPYKLAVLNLLALGAPYDRQPPDAFQRHVSVEDWLWQCLWFATVKNEKYDLGKLQDVITGKARGKFFADDRGNPFRYAYFLLVVQKFEQAVNHL